jgi:hypothetical protein
VSYDFDSIWIREAEMRLTGIETGTPLHRALLAAIDEHRGLSYVEDCFYFLPFMDQSQLRVASNIVLGLHNYGVPGVHEMSDEQRNQCRALALATEAIEVAFWEEEAMPDDVPIFMDRERARYLEDGDFKDMVISRVDDIDRICAIIRDHLDLRVPFIEAVLDGTVPVAIAGGVL